MTFLLSLNDLTVNKPWNDKMINLIYIISNIVICL